ncbi:MAG: hypothetical protein IT307_14775 [Chloroflexi bacterium]|nr:hypothetical protein [Chloroflexota bacterium]
MILWRRGVVAVRIARDLTVDLAARRSVVVGVLGHARHRALSLGRFSRGRGLGQPHALERSRERDGRG